MRSLISNKHGLTLLELVVGILITGIAVAGGYAAFAALVAHRGRVERATDQVIAESATRDLLATWLAGARLTPERIDPTFRGFDGSRARRADDILEFETTAPAIDAAVARVRLAIDQDPDTPERGLVADLSTIEGRLVQRVVLDSTAESFDARYLGRVSGGRIWLDSWISSTLLPVGVQLTIAGRDTLRRERLLDFPITVPLGGGA